MQKRVECLMFSTVGQWKPYFSSWNTSIIGYWNGWCFWSAQPNLPLILDSKKINMSECLISAWPNLHFNWLYWQISRLQKFYWQKFLKKSCSAMSYWKFNQFLYNFFLHLNKIYPSNECLFNFRAAEKAEEVLNRALRSLGSVTCDNVNIGSILKPKS